jgi:hypothetical protein
VLVDPHTNFVANVNGENRTTTGVEFALNKGDFNRNGFAGQLAFTYTWAYSQYKVFPTGGSFVTGINQAITAYNALTKAGGGAQCYTLATATTPGAPTACGPGTIANPYYNSAPQALFDPNGKYFPYNQQIGAGANGISTSNLVPYVAALIVQYKKDRLRITPSVQFFAGSRYGTPFASGGIDPTSCAAVLPGATPATDPRYAGTGLSAGGSYDASSCAGAITIPNPYTKKFDGIGEFVQPNLLNVNLQVAYDINPRMTLQLTGANLFSRCWGGSNVPWMIGGTIGCGYANALAVGNFYNPGDAIQPGFQYPYAPVFGSALQGLSQQAQNPFQLFVELRFNKL